MLLSLAQSTAAGMPSSRYSDSCARINAVSTPRRRCVTSTPTQVTPRTGSSPPGTVIASRASAAMPTICSFSTASTKRSMSCTPSSSAYCSSLQPVPKLAESSAVIASRSAAVAWRIEMDTSGKCALVRVADQAVSAPGADDAHQLAEAVDDRVRLALDRPELRDRNVAVRHQYRAHADGLRAVDVVEQPIPHEHRACRVAHVDRVERGTERLGMRLGPRDLGRVHGAVDEVEYSVAFEDPLVLAARPDRVRQHAHANVALAQRREQCRDVRVEERVRLPPLVEQAQHLLGVRDVDRSEHFGERRAAVLVTAANPHFLFGGEQPGREVVVTHRREPCLERLDGMPRRQSAAPVEDHRLDATHAAQPIELDQSRQLSRTVATVAC